MPPARGSALELTPAGAFPGSSEAAVFSGVDEWLYVAPAEKLTGLSNAFTIAVSDDAWSSL